MRRFSLWCLDMRFRIGVVLFYLISFFSVLSCRFFSTQETEQNNAPKNQSARTAPPREPLQGGVYVWQRAWTDEVDDAVTQLSAHAGMQHAFMRLWYLAAEIKVDREKSSVSRVYPVDVHGDILQKYSQSHTRPANPVVRIYESPHPIDQDPLQSKMIDAVLSEVTRTAGMGFYADEIQIDYDCPAKAAKIDEYARFLQELRRKLPSNVAVTITALPAWFLGNPDSQNARRTSLQKLLRSIDGWTLQVHWLDPPKTVQDFDKRTHSQAPDQPHDQPHDQNSHLLCDIDAALRDVKTAAQISRELATADTNLAKPLWLALPTYGYVLLYDEKGQFKSLQAEGAGLSLPEGWQARTVYSDPSSLQNLVKQLKEIPTTGKDLFLGLQGVVWYRLPVSYDKRNWGLSTLLAVQNGDALFGKITVDVKVNANDAHIYDVWLQMDGNQTLSLPSKIDIELITTDKNTKIDVFDTLSVYQPSLRIDRGEKQQEKQILQWIPPPERAPFLGVFSTGLPNTNTNTNINTNINTALHVGWLRLQNQSNSTRHRQTQDAVQFRTQLFWQ